MRKVVFIKKDIDNCKWLKLIKCVLIRWFIQWNPISKSSIVVGSQSSPLQPSHLVIGKLETDDDVGRYLSCSTIGEIVQLDGMSLDADKYTWRTLQHMPTHVIKGRIWHE